MKRLAILLLLAACVNPSLSRTNSGTATVIPGAQLDEVRDAVVSQMTSKGYAVLSADKYRVIGERPIGTDMSGNYFSRRLINLAADDKGVAIWGSVGFVDKSPLPIRYDQGRETARMAVQGDVGADLAAIKAMFEKKGTATTK